MRAGIQEKEIARTGGTGRRRLGGLLVRRECWTFSWPAKIAGCVFFLGLAVVLLFAIHPFLACTERLNTDALVAEGWIHEWAMTAGAEEFRQHHYAHVYVTGGPAFGQGHYASIYDTLAHVGETRLKAAGAPAECIQMIPGDQIGRDRTYNDALALRRWFQEHHVGVRAINIVTEGAHARRTRLLYDRAFGGSMKIGVIAIPNPSYDAKRWWRYSEGVREVIGETVAYLYAKLLFHPAPPSP